MDTSPFSADARVEFEGQEFVFTAAEQQACHGPGNSWHGPGDPSTWLAVTVFQAVRRRHPALPNPPALELAACALGVTAQRLVDMIQWHENYMRWHDGDMDYRVL